MSEDQRQLTLAEMLAYLPPSHRAVQEFALLCADQKRLEWALPLLQEMGALPMDEDARVYIDNMIATRKAADE